MDRSSASVILNCAGLQQLRIESWSFAETPLGLFHLLDEDQTPCSSSLSASLLNSCLWPFTLDGNQPQGLSLVVPRDKHTLTLWALSAEHKNRLQLKSKHLSIFRGDQTSQSESLKPCFYNPSCWAASPGCLFVTSPHPTILELLNVIEQ